MVKKLDLTESRGFQWDSGNAAKVWTRHQVTPGECEQVLLTRPLVAATQGSGSASENRYFALGRTRLGRRLFVVFTVRGDLVRVISARDMSRREREVFRRAQIRD